MRRIMFFLSCMVCPPAFSLRSYPYFNLYVLKSLIHCIRYVKPIMFSAGIGQMDSAHAAKGDPEVGMWVVKVGGRADGREVFV